MGQIRNSEVNHKWIKEGCFNGSVQKKETKRRVAINQIQMPRLLNSRVSLRIHGHSGGFCQRMHLNTWDEGHEWQVGHWSNRILLLLQNHPLPNLPKDIPHFISKLDHHIVFVAWSVTHMVNIESNSNVVDTIMSEFNFNQRAQLLPISNKAFSNRNR